MLTIHLIDSIIALIAAFVMVGRLNKWDKTYIPIGKLSWESTVGVMVISGAVYAVMIFTIFAFYASLRAFALSFL